MGVTETVAKAGLVLLPCVLILAVAVKQLYRSGNTKHNQDTAPLVLFKRYAQAYYQPIKRLVLGYISFVKERIWLTYEVAPLEQEAKVVHNARPEHRPFLGD